MATQPQADAYGLLAQQAQQTTKVNQQPTSLLTTDSGTTNQQQNGTSSSVTNTDSKTTNMDPQSMAALQLLIRQLMGGGTQAMGQEKAARQEELAKLNQQRAGYTKEAALADATGAQAQAMRQVLEKLLPTINAGAAGAGTSANSMRALMTQKAALESSQAASALGLQAAVNYGNINNGTSQIISGLLSQADPATAALLNALNIAKGAVTTTNGTQTTKGATSQNRISSASSTENKNINYGGTQAAEVKAPNVQVWGTPIENAPYQGYAGSSYANKQITDQILQGLGGGDNSYQF